MTFHPLYIYNSYTKKKELFDPIHPPFVGMYVCGPTVYNDVHLGNVRTFMTFDIVYRLLKYLGYQVRYVRNITDVGHLVDDADHGEDKIAKIARLQQLEPMEIVQKYTIGFHDVMRLFNISPPSIEPSASGHIIEQIQMIEDIIKNGYAYEVKGSVYFDVVKFNEDHPYGTLSGRVLEDLLETTRTLDGQEEKRNKPDFALWKNADQSHIMKWPSPWGEGFPGWHIECSAMSTKYLGKTFDIHGGGMDLKFPHHESEIAQNIGACGHAPVNYWMHSNMLNFEGKKMSKSEGNSILPLQLINGDHPLLDKGYSPMTIRFLFLQSHYSSETDISIKSLHDAEKGLRRVMNALDYISKMEWTAKTIHQDIEQEIQLNLKQVLDNVCDDFNTAKAIANLFALTTHINTLHHQSDLGISEFTFNQLKKIYTDIVVEVFGLTEEVATSNHALDATMNLIIELRKSARAEKNWGLSDQIRDALKTAGIIIKDAKDGTTTYEIEN
ncbi:MAG TPA: cysteine--tRNA ligase [Chitinophagales bacterium]|nr:cysteine--tRNA ligase [Chitinophagales bacterium]